MKTFEVAVIGAGPAGIAACVQLKRYRLDFIIMEQGKPGGLLRNANLVENYPGFPQGISGIELAQKMLEQMQFAGIQVVHTKVESVTYLNGAFHLFSQAGIICAKILVVASGTKPRTFINLSIPKQLQSQVLYEMYPLAHIENMHIAIVGAGDAAFDYALNLARRNKVTILNRKENIRCLPLLWDRAIQSQNIEYRASIRIEQLEEHSNKKMLLNCVTSTGSIQLEIDFLIGALGRDPQIDFLSKELGPTVKGLEEQGLFYRIGDVQNGRYRQTAIAVGDGVRTAMKIYHQLRKVAL